jgi:hypothetical protein
MSMSAFSIAGGGLVRDAALGRASAGVQPGCMRFEPAWVLPDEQWHEAADHGRDPAPAKCLVILAPADDALVGGDLEEIEVAPGAVRAQRLDAFYLHVCPSVGFRGRGSAESRIDGKLHGARCLRRADCAPNREPPFDGRR